MSVTRDQIGCCCDPLMQNAHVIAWMKAQQDQHVWDRDEAMHDEGMRQHYGSYQAYCEEFALYGSQEQEDRDYETNARYDYQAELAAEHRDWGGENDDGDEPVAHYADCDCSICNKEDPDPDYKRDAKVNGDWDLPF